MSLKANKKNILLFCFPRSKAHDKYLNALKKENDNAEPGSLINLKKYLKIKKMKTKEKPVWKALKFWYAEPSNKKWEIIYYNPKDPRRGQLKK